MLDPGLRKTVADIRQKFLQCVQTLEQTLSFRNLLASSERLQAEWRDVLRVAHSPRLQHPPPPTFTCAFVGSTGSGKTSILAEMFPDLQKRGWLVTEVNDTTSQALIIRLGAPGSPKQNEVIVRSWEKDQIHRLISLAAPENERTNVKVSYQPDHFIIDGAEAKFEAEDMRAFKFPRRIELRPLPRPYTLTPEESSDVALIRSLTVKEPPNLVRTGPILNFDGLRFDSLQLRVAIKEIELRDSFSRIIAWAGGQPSQVAPLVFIDTPGLQVTGGIKDEVLRNILHNKNRQIIVELIRNDDLDVLVHVVLCPQQSAFAELWKAVIEQCSQEALADLPDRLILAINGVNRYFTNDDLKRKWEKPDVAKREGDHFTVSLEDNILNKMSERGTTWPARICFLDSLRIVTSEHSDYAAFYARQRPHLEAWNRPGSVCWATLERLKLTPTFQANVNALCDPSDRGQGFLVRQILELLCQNGPKLFTRKYLVRNGLLATLRSLREALLRNYEPNGQINIQAIQAAVRLCLRGLDLKDPSTIEEFARTNLDPRIEAIVLSEIVLADQDPARAEKWVGQAFQTLGQQLYSTLVRQSGITPQANQLFMRFLQDRLNKWYRTWGYKTAELPLPTRQFAGSRDLVLQALRLHGREMLYQLLIDGSSVDPKNIPQDAADQETIRQLFAGLDEGIRQAEGLCRQNGVAIG